MLSLMDKLNYLMTFCCVTFVSIHGRSEDLHVSCEVGLLVHRGTTWRIAPQQSLTVSCPAKHCGESLKVTWCKLLSTNNCEQITDTNNVEIRQNHDKVRLTSYLSFKQISIHDEGLYRCGLTGSNGSTVSHAINISVSDLHQGIANSSNDAFKSSSGAGSVTAGDTDGHKESWLPYFYICVSITLLVLTLTVLTFLSSYGWKRVLNFNYTTGEEMPTLVIPDLPKWSAPSTPVLQTHSFALNDIYSSSTAGTPTSPASLPCGDQSFATNSPVKTQESAVYAVINHRQARIHDRKQHITTYPVKNSEYAVVCVS